MKRRGGRPKLEDQIAALGFRCQCCGSVAVDRFKGTWVCGSCLNPTFVAQKVEDFVASPCGLGLIINNEHQRDQFYASAHKYKRKTNRLYARSTR